MQAFASAQNIALTSLCCDNRSHCFQWLYDNKLQGYQILDFPALILRTTHSFLFAGLVILSGLLVSCSGQNGISIENAWIPEAPSTVRALAGYMEIENHFAEDISLRAAKSPFFEYIELHRSISEKNSNMIRMVKQDQVKIAAGQSFAFKPAGYHLMLLNPRQELAINQVIPIILVFGNGQELEVDFQVRAYKLKLDTGGWF